MFHFWKTSNNIVTNRILGWRNLDFHLIMKYSKNIIVTGSKRINSSTKTSGFFFTLKTKTKTFVQTKFYKTTWSWFSFHIEKIKNSSDKMLLDHDINLCWKLFIIIFILRHLIANFIFLQFWDKKNISIFYSSSFLKNKNLSFIKFHKFNV